MEETTSSQALVQARGEARDAGAGAGGGRKKPRCGVCAKPLSLHQRASFQCKYCNNHFCGSVHLDWSAAGHNCPQEAAIREERRDRQTTQLERVVRDKVDNRL